MPMNLIDYTKHIMDILDDDNLTLTHVMICYKVILYYENNYQEIKEHDKEKIISVINHIYEHYTQSDQQDMLDELVEDCVNRINVVD